MNTFTPLALFAGSQSPIPCWSEIGLSSEVLRDVWQLAAGICEGSRFRMILLNTERTMFDACGCDNDDHASHDFGFCLRSDKELAVRALTTETVFDSRTTDLLVGHLPEVSFYAEMPILNGTGVVVGTLCFLDDMPHVLSDEQVRRLAALRRFVVREFEATKGVAELAVEKRMRLKEEAQSRWLRQVIEALPAAVYTTDQAGHITMFNRAAVEFSGRLPKIGSDSWCVSWRLFNLDGSPLPHDQCPMAVALRESRAVRGAEAIAERPDGTRITFRPYPTPLYGPSGELLGALNMLVDVTDRKRADASRRLLESAVTHSKEAILITDAVLDASGPKILFANPAFAAMTGYTPAEISGKSLWMLEGPLTDKAVASQILPSLARGESFHGELVNYRKDGSTIVLEWQIAPIRNEVGLVTHFVAGQRDVTERKNHEHEILKARDTAIETVRIKARFLANMSHELRTPLNTINGLAAILLEQDVSEDVKSSADLILRCGQNLLENIQTVLTHSSLEAGQLKLVAKPYELNEVILNALRIARGSAPDKRIDVDYGVCVQTPEIVIGDSFRLQQVLVNLLSNAVKFTDEGGIYLKVKAKREAHDWKLTFTVSDTGIGIEKELIGKLFTPFFQVDDTMRKRHAGTGLGLAIVKSLVAVMGGNIGVRSLPGRGSVFRFSIRAGFAPEAGTMIGSAVEPTLQGKRVLIVDGYDRRRKQLRTFAEAWGMHVVEEDAYGLLARGSQEDYDLAIRPHEIETDFSEARESVAKRVPEVWLKLDQTYSRLPDALYLTSLTVPFSPAQLSRALVDALTLERPSAAELVSTSRNTKLGERLPLRILAADDIHTNREVMSTMCRHLGYGIDLVEDGVAVLERLRAEKYDLVFLDVQMPRMDGLTAAREICSRWPERANRPRLVALTANAMAGDKEDCMAAGMDDYLSKPAVPRQIAACIEKLFGKSTATAPQVQAAPAAPSDSSLHWVDRKHLEQVISGGEGEFDPELLKQFYGALQADYGALRPRLVEACARGNATLAIELIHGLKGCVLTLGWARLGTYCAETLHAIRRGDYSGWSSIPTELEGLFVRSASEMEQYLAELDEKSGLLVSGEKLSGSK